MFLVDSPMSLTNSTKRDLLSVIAKIFDPLGLLSPLVITMKMLLQRMWLDKLSWDEPLSPELSAPWQAIVRKLLINNDFRIPRIVVCELYTQLELHIFTDASERAYGACAYIRSANDEGKCMVRLLMAKSRVAPIKPTTIPRLELCGAVVGTHLYEKISKSLRVRFSRVFCWTDSTIVLGWWQRRWLAFKASALRAQPRRWSFRAGRLLHLATCPNRQKPSRPNISWCGY